MKFTVSSRISIKVKPAVTDKPIVRAMDALKISEDFTTPFNASAYV